MIRILVTGENGYIGKTFKSYVSRFKDNKQREIYQVDKISLRDEMWRKKSFCDYDVVLHLAGIVHKKEKKQSGLYKKVNTDLTEQVALKAKNDGVKQFIFMSTLNVYGKSTGIINSRTKESPNTLYGLSKWEAEKRILKLKNDNFIVTILRPPMIYGANCKGNYKYLSRFIHIFHVFPYFQNERSMIYIGNLCECVKRIIDKKWEGILCPQNEQYVCTSELVRLIAKLKGEKIVLFKGTEQLIWRLFNKNSYVSKIFGSLTIDKTLSEDLIIGNYNLYNFKKSIERTEIYRKDKLKNLV